MSQLWLHKYRRLAIRAVLPLPLIIFSLCVFAPEASAQGADKSTLQKLWYGADPKAADTASLTAGIRLIKLYKKSPMKPDSVRIICMDMNARGLQNGNRRWRVNAWNELGDYHLGAGQIDSANNELRQALQFSTDEDIERIQVYANLGRMLSMQSQNDSAIVYLKKGIELVKKYNHGQNKLPQLYGNLSIVHINQGDYLEGIQFEQEAIKYGNDRDQTLSYYNIGIIFKVLHLQDEARLNFQQSLLHARKVNAPKYQAFAYIALIEMAANVSEIDSLLQQGTEILEGKQLTDMELHLMAGAATRYVSLKAFDKAKPLVDRCLYMLESKHIESQRVILQVLKAWLLYNDGKFHSSLKICASVEKEIESLGSASRRDYYDLMSSNYQALGQTYKALLYARKKEDVLEEIENAKLLRSVVSTYFKNQAEQEKNRIQTEMDIAAKAAEAIQKRQNLIITFIGSFSFMLLLLAAVIYYFYNQKKSAARRLEHLNERLQAEQQKLHRKNEKLKRFSGVVSHDILSNLDLILSTGNVLVGSRPRPETLTKYYEISQETSAQLKTYCLDLLEEARQTNPANGHTPNPVLQSVYNRYEAALRAKNFRVDLDTLPPTPLPPVVMEQLFQNLISNALRHASTAESPWLHIGSGTDEQGRMYFVVEDNGPGVPESRAELIFQGKSQQNPNGNGQKIGLSFLKQTLQEYDADIRVEQRLGGGARFLITFGEIV